MARRLVRRMLVAVAAIIVVIAAVLAAFAVQRVRRERLTAEEAAPRGGRFVQAGDARVFVQEAGAPGAPAVLLVHGTGAWSEIWRGTITTLAGAGYRVIAIDVPPFGYSQRLEGAGAFAREKQARRIVAVLDALGIGEVALVGHSVGARPTIEAAMSIPSRVRALILVDPALGFAGDAGTPRFEQNHPSFAMRALFGARPVVQSIVAAYGTNPSSTGRLFRSFVSRQEAVTAERIRMLQQPLAVRGTTAAQSDWLTYLLVEHDSARTSELVNLRAFERPVLLVWGSDDRVTPLWQGRALAAAMPHARLEVIAGAGHIPFIEAPAEFDGIVTSFLGATR